MPNAASRLFEPYANLDNTRTLSAPTDVIGTTVLSDRYGWIVINDFLVLPIDDARPEGRAGCGIAQRGRPD